MSHSSTALIPSERPPEELAAFGIASTLLPVRLFLQSGATAAGAVFLRKIPSADRETESLGARLNEPGVAFLPFAAGGRVELVRLAAVAYVELLDEAPEIARLHALGAATEPVEIELANGESLAGDLIAIAPPGRRRLSDLLNRGETFLPLAAPGRTLFVNRDAIVRVLGRA
jgi:hypothetical protein